MTENLTSDLNRAQTSEEQSQPDTFQDLYEDRVRVEVLDDHIEARTLSNTAFQAWVDKDRIAHLYIKTVRGNGSRDPYFERHRAAELARRAISHFDQVKPVRGLKFDWGRPASDSEGDRSDNYSKYLDARNALASLTDYEEAKKQALLHTWTFGNVALPLGFSDIDTVIEKGDISAPITVTGIAYRLHTSESADQAT